MLAIRTTTSTRGSLPVIDSSAPITPDDTSSSGSNPGSGSQTPSGGLTPSTPITPPGNNPGSGSDF